MGEGVGWASSVATPLLSLAGSLDHTKTSGMRFNMGPFAKIINYSRERFGYVIRALTAIDRWIDSYMELLCRVAI